MDCVAKEVVICQYLIINYSKQSTGEIFMSTPYDKEQKILELFIDSAKTYTQLSTGALVLTITFIREILGQKDAVPRDNFLTVSWVCFLIAIGAGAAYQYLAIKYLEKIADLPIAFPLPERLVRQPGAVYGLMMFVFYLGAIFFTIAAVRRMYY
jgi:hypothetical protein